MTLIEWGDPPLQARVESREKALADADTVEAWLRARAGCWQAQAEDATQPREGRDLAFAQADMLRTEIAMLRAFRAAVVRAGLQTSITEDEIPD